MTVEIERKWILRSMPEFFGRKVSGVHHTIRQDYIEVGLLVLRLRRRNGLSYLTLKSGKGIERSEWEVEVPLWVDDALFPCATYGLSKHRYVLQDGKPEVVLDVHHGSLSDLIVVEAEWLVPDSASTDEMMAVRTACAEYLLPDWLGLAREVSEDERYKAVNLAQHGLPEGWDDWGDDS